MSNPTTPFSWQMPTATDLVTDLPADFEVFGQAVATSLADLLGGASGYILSKNSATDMDFVWIANDQGDITGITATSPLTGGGLSGAITVGIQDGTTAQKGAVQLENSTSSTSTTTAAVPASVKSAYDLAAAATPRLLLFNAQTGTTYTLVLSDADKLVTTSNASAVTVTIPPSVFSAGQQINVQSIGVGLTSFAQGAGVTITSTGATATAPILRARYSAATIICTASNVFTIIGDLS
jgi:phage-related tail fiber protein